jgi:hypothetical protein
MGTRRGASRQRRTGRTAVGIGVVEVVLGGRITAGVGSRADLTRTLVPTERARGATVERGAAVPGAAARDSSRPPGSYAS